MFDTAHKRRMRPVERLQRHKSTPCITSLNKNNNKNNNKTLLIKMCILSFECNVRKACRFYDNGIICISSKDVTV